MQRLQNKIAIITGGARGMGARTSRLFIEEGATLVFNVYRDDDGYIWFVGRKDDIIKSSGYRISPFEVESILQKHPAVMECAVTGVEDAKRGQIVKATIVLVPVTVFPLLSVTV